MDEPRLQVAFDATRRADLGNQIARATAGGVDCIEVGTPLLKRYGIAIVEEARRLVARPTSLYVDVKMLDFPHLELSPALQAGADEVTALAFASDEALGTAMELAREYTAVLSVSTMNYPMTLLARRLTELRSLGVTRFVAHGAGMALTTAASDAAQRVRLIRRTVQDAHLLVGGGITVAEVPRFLAMNPATVIVGRAIADAPDIAVAVDAFKRQLASKNSPPGPNAASTRDV
jgi:3-keto-L-gulonate-6-phosphate decarboxylase